MKRKHKRIKRKSFREAVKHTLHFKIEARGIDGYIFQKVMRHASNESEEF